MPKLLSLKKAQQKAPPKNQKSIIQFFKSANAPATHTANSSQDKTQKTREKTEEKKSIKRKAQSPTNLETIEIIDEDCESEASTAGQRSDKGLHKPKKLKNDHPNHVSPVKNETKCFTKSPHKSNGFVNNSPHKENFVEECTPGKSPIRPKHTPIKSNKIPNSKDKVEKIISNHEESSTNKDRSPLTSLDIVNVLENSPKVKSCSRNVDQKLRVTPKKVLKFDDKVENNKLKLSKNNVTPKQSPTKAEHLSVVPNFVKLTPEKLKDVPSPSKSGSTVRSLNFDPLEDRPAVNPLNIDQVENVPSIKSLNFDNVENVPSIKSINFDNVENVPSIKSINFDNVENGATKKSLDFANAEVEDAFGDDWILDEGEESMKEDLDLTKLQRCEVVSINRQPSRLEVIVKNTSGRATCFVDGVWLDTPLCPGDIISIIAGRDSNGHFTVNNTSGLISLRPDHLVSSTSVVAGVFCKRKALLQERWRGIDSANTAMTIGILIHELVQKALTESITDMARLHKETDKIIKESVQMLYDAGLSEEEARSNIQAYIPPLAEFMNVYVAGKAATKPPQKEQWVGRVEKVLDIEENLCCPQLGLKGKIDATLEVTIHERKGRQRAIVPLELKSGKASVSAEHRGQLVLYGMMLSVQADQDPLNTLQRGLLLYLKERVDVREVSCGHPERRDLMMLRNQLVQYLAADPQSLDPEQLTDIEDASCLLQQRLPEPINHQNACTKCPYLTLCSLHLWHTDGPSVSESHPLSKLQAQALGHLSPDHVKYFLNWTALLKIQERCQMLAAPLKALWTDSVEKRSKRGSCAANLLLKSVEISGDRYIHVLSRPNHQDNESVSTGKVAKGPQEGDFSIVSLDNRPWVAAGVVAANNDKELTILLERDLSRRLPKDTRFHIDTYESYATTVQNLTNLGMLLEDSERAERLRNLIIDKQPPVFDEKLPREVGRLGTKLMRSLNIQQQRAVLKALSAKHYALLQGLPGTGKTQTISVLIQMLVGLKQRVLVTAHTHSAVDNVLKRLPASLRVMRLGSSARVAPSLLDKCEQTMAASCDTPEALGKLYDSMEVVGVTCLGAAHAMLTRTAFDVCIMDEATQVVQSTAIRPLLFARRFLLAGDPDQLPPVVRSRAARHLGLEESLFHRLMSEHATSTLQLQYRMNQPLADIANEVAYNNRLKCADDNVANATLDIDMTQISQSPPWLLHCCDTKPENAAIFIDMKPLSDADRKEKDTTCSNIDEACVILTLVDTLVKGGVKPSEIGVIAPYRDQVSLLRRAILRRGAECSTVDQFQGRDKSVILYSCTKRKGEDREVKEGEILNDQRRLAVGVTRAKHKFVVVGDATALQRYKPLKRLVQACTPVALNEHVVSSVVHKYKTEIV